MGRTVILTGSNRGIGSAILNRFAREKDVCILAHARKKTPEFLAAIDKLLKENPGIQIVPFYCDLSNQEEIKTSFSEILKQYKKIDVLINNAGVVMPNKAFLMMDDETLRTSFEVNFFAPVKITQMVCRAMIRNKSGAIVNMSSVAAFTGVEGQFEYTSGKAAIIGMTRKLAVELSAYNIRVNAVAPGMTDTDMIYQMNDNMRDDLLNKTVSHRLGKPEEIANAVYFLASDEAAFVNGQTLIVNGGGL